MNKMKKTPITYYHLGVFVGIGLLVTGLILCGLKVKSGVYSDGYQQGRKEGWIKEMNDYQDRIDYCKRAECDKYGSPVYYMGPSVPLSPFVPQTK